MTQPEPAATAETEPAADLPHLPLLDDAIAEFLPATMVFGRATLDGRPAVILGDDFTVRFGDSDRDLGSADVDAGDQIFHKLLSSAAEKDDITPGKRSAAWTQVRECPAELTARHSMLTCSISVH